MTPAMVIDARWLANGVGTYACNVVRELRALHPDFDVEVLTSPSGVERFAPICDRVRILRAGVHSIQEQIQIARAVPLGALLHCTHYNAPLLRPGPLVVTIPDVTPLLDSDYHSSWKSRLLGAAMLRAIARRADHIITVSEYSRARIVETLRVPSAKITVAYNGVDPVFHPMEPTQAREICAEQLGMREHFLLYVGNLRAHKNLGALLHAYQQCRRIYRVQQHLLLIATGTPQSMQVLRALTKALGIGDFVQIVGGVDQSVLVAAYNSADAVVVPSLEEGFGLPVVEAMACGTPVACSDASALPEIAGDAAAYFNPRNVADIAQTIQTVLEDNNLRRYMCERGRAWAQRYTWASSAQIHFDVYSQFVDWSAHSLRCNQDARSGSEGIPLAHAAPTQRV